jgi:hypothetical protein
MRMHFAEAMELLVTKLDEVEKIDDFLQRFDIDPDGATRQDDRQPGAHALVADVLSQRARGSVRTGRRAPGP